VRFIFGWIVAERTGRFLKWSRLLITGMVGY